MGKITLLNVAEELAARSGQSKEVADKFMHAVVDAIEKGLRQDKMVKVKGLGTFKLMDMSDRDSIDVNTGERITIKGYTKVSFTPDSSMKEFVNRPFAHFEPTELNEGYPDEDVTPDNEEPLTADSVEEAVAVEAVAEEAVAVETAVEEAVAEEPTAEHIDVKEESTEEVAVSMDMQSEDVVDEKPTEKEDAFEQETAGVEVTESVAATAPIEVGEPDDTNDSGESTEECADIPSEDTMSADLKTEAEEQQVSPVEEIQQAENDVDEDPEEKPVVPAVEVAEKKGGKRMGCWSIGFLMILLIVAAAIGTYCYFVDVTMFESDESALVEQGEIKVNPNLGKELGEAWNDDEPKVEMEQATASEEDLRKVDTVKVEVMPTPVNTVVEKQNVEEKTSQAEPLIKAPTASASFVMTEALAAKNVKDITLADTTDYVIDGTQATHILQSGETIVQLSRKYYGDKRLWPYIVKHNNIADFNKVDVGMAINIPVLKSKTVE